MIMNASLRLVKVAVVFVLRFGNLHAKKEAGNVRNPVQVSKWMT